jgi:hypothetical protein
MFGIRRKSGSEKVLLLDDKTESVRIMAEHVKEDPSRMNIGQMVDAIKDIAGPLATDAEREALLTLLCAHLELSNPTNFGVTAQESIKLNLELGRKDMIVDVDLREHEI